MAPVLISCPITGRLVPTGIEAEGEDELNTGGHVLLKCPDCGGDHQRGLEDAALAVMADAGGTDALPPFAPPAEQSARATVRR